LKIRFDVPGLRPSMVIGFRQLQTGAGRCPFARPLSSFRVLAATFDLGFCLPSFYCKYPVLLWELVSSTKATLLGGQMKGHIFVVKKKTA